MATDAQAPSPLGFVPAAPAAPVGHNHRCLNACSVLGRPVTQQDGVPSFTWEVSK